MTTSLSKYMIAAYAIVLLGIFYMKPFQTTEMPTEETLVIGLQSGYPPFEFMDPSGNIIGFDVELAEIIAKQLHKALVIKDMELDAEILSLKQGKIDLILSGMNISSSRLQEIWMVPYHGDNATSLSLIFWNAIPAGVKAIEDIALLSHAFVSVEAGSIPDLFLERYKDIHVKSFQGAFAPLMDVKYGKSIATLVEPDVAEYLKSQHPEIQILSVPLPEDATVMGFGIGIKKGNQELLTQIETIIQELKSSGELKQLEDKWFKENV